MKKTNKIKLSLNRQTLVVLTHKNLGGVQGGVGVTVKDCDSHVAGCEPSGIIACTVITCAETL